jgi:hypothetical protein
MDGQASERLSCTLREANIREALLLGRFEDVADTVRNIMEGEFVDRKVPESVRGWRQMNGFFGVLVASIVAKLKKCQYYLMTFGCDDEETHPDIVASLH